MTTLDCESREEDATTLVGAAALEVGFVSLVGPAVAVGISNDSITDDPEVMVSIVGTAIETMLFAP